MITPELHHVIDEAVRRAIEFSRPEYLTRQQLAAELDITVETLANLEAEGLPVLRLGPRTFRFKRSQVDAWLAARVQA